MKPYHKNPRQITKRQMDDLGAWLSELGDLSGIVHDLNTDEIIGGNQRGRVFNVNECEVELTDGPHEPDEQGTVSHGFIIWKGKRYAYRQVRWTEKQAEKANIVANKSGGGWDFDTLANEFDAAELIEWGFEPFELGLGGDDGNDTPDKEEARATLADRFIVPPFSVLDARQGYWQERKRAWLALGLQGELGRLGEDAASYKSQSRLDEIVTKRHPASLPPMQDGVLLIDSYRGRKGNPDINGIYSRAVNAGSTASQTGVSVFDPVLCEVAYRWFCPPGGHVINPTAGESVYGIVAGYLGYTYEGVEIRAEQIANNELQAVQIGVSDRVKWIHGDGRDTAQLVAPADLIMCCPPYHDLEIYSDNPQDISTLDDYDEFMQAYRRIVASAVEALKPDRFACFVVGDIRDKRGHYRNFVSDTIGAFRATGCELYNEAVFITPAGSLPVRTARAFPIGRKLGKSHQNVLVFVKGDWRKAVEACGPVTVEVPDGFGTNNDNDN